MIHLTPGRLRNDSACEKIFNAIPPLPSPRLRNSLRSNNLCRSIPSTSLKGRLRRLNLLLCRFTPPQFPVIFMIRRCALFMRNSSKVAIRILTKTISEGYFDSPQNRGKSFIISLLSYFNRHFLLFERTDFTASAPLRTICGGKPQLHGSRLAATATSARE